MDSTTPGCEAFDETIVFLSFFKDLHDPRQRGKVCYKLEEILLLCLLAVLAGAETITDIALFGVKKRDLLRRFRPFRDGTPTHDHLGDILAALDGEQFQRCFAAWVAAITGLPEGRDRHRWENLPPVRFEKRGQERDPRRLRLRRAAACRSRSGEGGGKIQ
jgi:hypothetical protein